MNDHLSQDTQHVILVVEDDAGIRDLLQDYLTDVGFTVHAAETADEARTVISTRKPIELVLTDINMPGSMDGAALANWLKQFAPAMPVILVSGKESYPESPQDKRWFLRKPFELEAMTDRIRKILASDE